MKTNMNKMIQALAAALLLDSNMNAQDYIIVQGGSETHFHKIETPYTNQDVQDVFDWPTTESGDTVYLPGVIFTMNADIILNKGLVVMGTGIHPDSALVAGAAITTFTTNSDFLINTGANGCELHGICFANNCAVQIGSTDALGDVSNVLFNRCYFGAGLYLGYNTNTTFGSSEITVKQCVIDITLHVRDADNATISNNLIKGEINAGTQSTLIANNIFIGEFDAAVNSTNALFQNNILQTTTQSVNVATPNYYFNNIWVQPSGSSLTFGAEVLNDAIASSYQSLNVNQVFVTPPGTNPLTTYTYQADYHLNPIGPNYNLYMNGAIDGGEIGIYGGQYPWKVGLLPFNPHWQELTVPSTSNNNGLIGISIKGAAQQN